MECAVVVVVVVSERVWRRVGGRRKAEREGWRREAGRKKREEVRMKEYQMYCEGPAEQTEGYPAIHTHTHTRMKYV